MAGRLLELARASRKLRSERALTTTAWLRLLKSCLCPRWLHLRRLARLKPAAAPKTTLARAVASLRNHWEAPRRYTDRWPFDNGRLRRRTDASPPSHRTQDWPFLWAVKRRAPAPSCRTRFARAQSVIASSPGRMSATFWSACTRTARIWKKCRPTATSRRIPVPATAPQPTSASTPTRHHGRAGSLRGLEVLQARRDHHDCRAWPRPLENDVSGGCAAYLLIS